MCCLTIKVTDVSRFKKYTWKKKIIFIDWKNASFVFNNKNKKFFQIVESALTSKLLILNLASGFYNLPDNIVQDIISLLHI